LALTHIVLRLNEAFAKHLQDMPVKVADRDDTGCADADLTGSLLIYDLNYISKITVLSIKIF
jgi:hypothetical protein